MPVLEAQHVTYQVKPALSKNLSFHRDQKYQESRFTDQTVKNTSNQCEKHTGAQHIITVLSISVWACVQLLHLNLPSATFILTTGKAD